MFRRLFAALGRSLLWAAGDNPNSDPEAFYQSLIAGRGNKSAAGLRVTEDSALSYSAFWTGTTILGECIGSLPLDVYRRIGDDGREKDTNHLLAQPLRRRPNPHMSAMCWKESLVINAICWGNAYSEIERNGAGEIVNLWPLHPSIVTPRIDDAANLYYEVRPPNTQDAIPLLPEEVLHITGPSLDGICGMGVVKKAKESIGLGIACETYGASFFGNNAMPGMILKHPSTLTDEVRDKFIRSWRENYGGLTNAHRVAILQQGMEAQVLSVAPELAQFLETRRFQTEEIARWLRMPLHMLRDTTRGASYASLEVQSAEFLVYTLRPWLARFEDEFTYKLLDEAERDTHFIEFNPNALLRADLTTRYNAYTQGRNGGWLSVNDIRRTENLPPIENGDIYLEPLNMQPAGQTADSLPAPATDTPMPPA